MKKFCGLDFGTSNSTIGIWRGGEPTLVHVEGDKTTIPSSIFFDFETDSTLFGRSATDAYIDGYPGRLLRAIKSVLGTPLMNEATQIKSARLPFTAILGMLLEHLKKKAEAELGRELDSVVLGRPVFFVDGKPDRDRLAQDTLEQVARDQGFKDIRFQYEPIAAALSYEHAIETEQVVLVADIGGGTSDFSVVRLSPARARAVDRAGDILANGGVHIGGTDFDRLFNLAQFMPLLGYRTRQKTSGVEIAPAVYLDLADWTTIHQVYLAKRADTIREMVFDAEFPDLIERLQGVVKNKQGHALAIAVEQAKIGLSTQQQVKAHVDMIEGGLILTLAEAQLEAAIADALSRITATVLATIAEAGATPAQIDAVFLTGGSAQMPAVRRAILRAIPNGRIVTGDMLGSVGIGLTLDAKRHFG